MEYPKVLFLDNLFIKIISLIFALILWSYLTPISPRDTLEVNYVLPLELKNIPENMMTLGEIDDRISVRLKGRQAIIREIDPSKLNVNLDLSNALVGTRFYNLNPANINVPPTIEVVRIEPKTIKIEIVTLQRKDVDVRVNITGSPASGYIIKRITVNPARLTIEGPASEIKNISFLEGLTLNVGGTKNSIFREVKLGTPFRNIRIIGKDVVTIDVGVDQQ